MLTPGFVVFFFPSEKIIIIVVYEITIIIIIMILHFFVNQGWQMSSQPTYALRIQAKIKILGYLAISLFMEIIKFGTHFA